MKENLHTALQQPYTTLNIDMKIEKLKKKNIEKYSQ